MPVIPPLVMATSAETEHPVQEAETTDLPLHSASTDPSDSVLDAKQPEASDTTVVPITLKSSKPATNLFSSGTPRSLSFSSLRSSTENSIPTAAPTLSSHLPPLTNLRQSTIRTPGLENAGQTCYVNSCVQALLGTPNFRTSLNATASLISTLNSAIPAPDTSQFEAHANLIREFSTLSKQLQDKSQTTYSPNYVRAGSYLRALSMLDERYGAASDQQDVQEFLVFLLASLDEGAVMLKELLNKSNLTTSVPTSLGGLAGNGDHSGGNGVGDASGGSVVAGDGDRDPNPKKRSFPDSGAERHQYSFNAHENDETTHGLSEKDDDLVTSISKRAKSKETDTELSTATHTLPGPSLTTLLAEDGLFELKYDSIAVEEGVVGGNAMDVDPVPDASAVLPSAAPEAPPSSSIAHFMPTSTHLPNTLGKKDAIGGWETDSIFPHQFFQGEISSTFQCLECERESGRPEAFFDISLAIQEDKDLLGSLNDFFGKSILGGQDKYACESCNYHTEAFHYQRFSQLPKVLIIHLKRFSWTEPVASIMPPGRILRSINAGGGAGKLGFHVGCPFTIDIPYTWLSSSLQRQMHHSGSISSQSTSTMMSAQNSGAYAQQLRDNAEKEELKLSRNLLLLSSPPSLAQYQLYAVIYHTGSSTTFGHYTCAVQIDSDSSTGHSPPTWALFDDHLVTPVSHDWVMRSVSAEAGTPRTAYIMLYKRVA